MNIHDKIKKIQRRTDNRAAPDEIGVHPTGDGEAVVRVRFGRSDVVLPLSEAEEVTGDRDALDAPGQLLVEVRSEKTNLRNDPKPMTVSKVLTGVSSMKLVHDFDIRKETPDAIYTSISEGYANETRHNRSHLPVDPEGEFRYWLFE